MEYVICNAVGLLMFYFFSAVSFVVWCIVRRGGRYWWDTDDARSAAWLGLDKSFARFYCWLYSPKFVYL